MNKTQKEEIFFDPIIKEYQKEIYDLLEQKDYLKTKLWNSIVVCKEQKWELTKKQLLELLKFLGKNN